VLKLLLSISENFGTDPLGDVLLITSMQEDSLLLAPPFQRGKAESSDGLHPQLQDYCWVHVADLGSQEQVKSHPCQELPVQVMTDSLSTTDCIIMSEIIKSQNHRITE